MARRAGISAATNATTIRRALAPNSATGSDGRTSKSIEVSTHDPAKATPRPTAQPIKVTRILTENHPAKPLRCGVKGNSDAELSRLLGHTGSHDAVEADTREPR